MAGSTNTGSQPSGITAFVMCCVWGFLTYQLLHWHGPGETWTGLVAIFTGFLLASNAWKVLLAYRRFAESRRQFKAFKLAGAALGGSSARWSVLTEIRKAGLNAAVGLWLAVFTDERGRRHVLRYDGQNTVLLLGPPSAHKSTSVLANSLLPVPPRFRLRGRQLSRTLLWLLRLVIPPT